MAHLKADLNKVNEKNLSAAVESYVGPSKGDQKLHDKSVNQSKASIKPYEEEESYENPVNISRAPGCQDDYVDIRSEYAGAAVNLSIN